MGGRRAGGGGTDWLALAAHLLPAPRQRVGARLAAVKRPGSGGDWLVVARHPRWRPPGWQMIVRGRAGLPAARVSWAFAASASPRGRPGLQAPDWRWAPGGAQQRRAGCVRSCRYTCRRAGPLALDQRGNRSATCGAHRVERETWEAPAVKGFVLFLFIVNVLPWPKL